MLGMAKRDERSGDAASRSEFFGRPGENKEWFTARLFLDVDVTPSHRFADSGAECFRNSLFRRETRSQVTGREFHRHRVFNLAIGKNAMKKTVAESVNGPLDAPALDKIDTGTDHTHVR